MIYNAIIVTYIILLDVENLLRNRTIESTRIEYKKDLDPNKIIHTICAYANDIENLGGGYIVVGVEDDNGLPKFPISGLQIDKIDKMVNDIISFCNNIEPRYLPEISIDTYEGVNLLVIWCPAGYGRPYKVNDDLLTRKTSKSYYIRKFGRTIKASIDEERLLYDVSSTIPYDDRPNYRATIEDFDINLIRQYFHNVKSKKVSIINSMSLDEMCEDLHIIAGPSENMRPLNVGVLLFSNNPEEFIKGSRIEIVNMPDPTGKQMDERVFTGPIDFSLKNALSYIKGNVIQERVIKLDNDEHALRIQNYPYTAIEELLTNAVYHKSYEINEPITVVITKNTIEITSIPGIDISISNEDIKNYDLKSKRYRNRRIGDFFKELRLTEGRNTGIPNALEALDLNGSKAPIFKMDDNRTFLTVIIEVNDEFKTDETKKQRLSRKAIKENVINYFKHNNESSINNLAQELGYKSISKTLTSVVNELIEEGILSKKVKLGKYSKICINKTSNN